MKYLFIFVLFISFFNITNVYSGNSDNVKECDFTPCFERVEGGVKFTVEKLDKASVEALNMERISSENHKQRLSKKAVKIYAPKFEEEKFLTKEELERFTQINDSLEKIEDKKLRLDCQRERRALSNSAYERYKTHLKEQEQNILEVCSEMPDNLVMSNRRGFLGTLTRAYNNHLPLRLKPDHFWLPILCGLVKHVDKHPEELRDKFVSHQGKKHLEIIFEGVNRNTTQGQWEKTVFPQFAQIIKENITSDSLHDITTGSFSNSSPTMQACKQIALMSATKNYFSYGVKFMCGIPEITLMGTEQDWASLVDRTNKLSEFMMPDFKEEWMSKLMPVLEQVHASSKGEVNSEFWQKMVGLHRTYGSSASTYLTGWIGTLYPYLKGGHFNRKMKHWHDNSLSGPEPSEIPSDMVSVPVTWKSRVCTSNIHFHTGFLGCTQDRENGGELMPQEGWMVTYDIEEPDEESKTTIE